jgi:anaerobic ribonucleoside-triphosphate reductase
MSNETESIKTKETKVPCEVYSRIVGYLRPVQNWNKGKRQEFATRRVYRVRTQDIN